MFRPLGCLEELWIKYFPFGFLFHLIDATLYDVFFALSCIFWFPYHCREYYENSFREMLPVYSARSGFDLILQALNLPAESEILMSGLNITHMGMLPEIHGHRLVTYDINLETLEPDYEHLEKLLTNQTKVIVYAQLFGKRNLLYKLAQFAEKHGLILIEDSAQYFPDTHYTGDHLADFNIFSFGLSKNFTCFGGGLIKVKDQKMRERCWNLLSRYPKESGWTYLITVLSSGTKIILSSTMFVWMIDTAAGWFDSSFENLLNRVGKEFSYQDRNDKLLKKFRRQCSSPHLEVMYHRVMCVYTWNGVWPEIFDYHQARKKSGDKIDTWIESGVGGNVMVKGYWLFPILVHNREELMRRLRNAGFIATKSATSFGYIGPKDSETVSFCRECSRFMKEVVYLPYGPELPNEKIWEMKEIISSHKIIYSNDLGGDD